MILVLNAGSSSLKAALLDGDREVVAGSVTEVGATGVLRLGAQRREARAPDHEAALALLLEALRAEGVAPGRLGAAAHRVVHGGALAGPARVAPDVVAAIEEAAPLAPLHNPPALAGIRAVARLAPGLPQFVSLDTAFHATIPAAPPALPEPWRTRLRPRGFHGLSYAWLVGALRGQGLLPRRLLAFHLGNGASACAILDGRSVATTMAYSPLSGLVMGTRAGDLDPLAVLALARAEGIDGAARLLSREAGLKALAGTSDMAAILARGDPAARAAVDAFVGAAVRHGGAMAAAMGGADAVAFTGGIGVGAAPVRDRILAGLAHLGPARHHVVAAQEERQIAAEARALGA